MIVGRRELFLDRKSIHIKLKNQDHFTLKTYLFEKNLTMQDAFEGFAELVVLKDKRALNILEYLCKKKIEDFIKEGNKDKEETKKEKFSSKKYYLSELETDALYNLISDENDENSEQKDENNSLIQKDDKNENF